MITNYITNTDVCMGNLTVPAGTLITAVDNLYMKALNDNNLITQVIKFAGSMVRQENDSKLSSSQVGLLGTER